MNTALYRLVYISRNEIEGDDATVHREVDQILNTARTANPSLDVSGALMFNAGCFAQVLEGPHDAVQEIFERVQCDSRHSQVVVLDFSPIAERNFEHWSMAYVGQDEAALDLFAGFAGDSQFDASNVSGERIYELLHAQLLESEALHGLRRSA